MLLLFLGLLLQWELDWLDGQTEEVTENIPEEEQARVYYELYENIWK